MISGFHVPLKELGGVGRIVSPQWQYFLENYLLNICHFTLTPGFTLPVPKRVSGACQGFSARLDTFAISSGLNPGFGQTKISGNLNDLSLTRLYTMVVLFEVYFNMISTTCSRKRLSWRHYYFLFCIFACIAKQENKRRMRAGRQRCSSTFLVVWMQSKALMFKPLVNPTLN